MYKMTWACLLLIFATRVSLEPQSYQHPLFLSHRSRDRVPMQSGFVFSQMNDHPPEFESFGKQNGVYLGDGIVKRYRDIAISDPSPLYIKNSDVLGATHPTKPMKFDMPVVNMNLPFTGLKSLPKYDFIYKGSTETSVPYTTTSWSEHSFNYELSKAKAKHSDPLILAKEKTDEMLSKGTWPKYDLTHDFHIDNDDVKSLSRNSYEWWPYFVHSPYKYEIAAVDSEMQKAKEKRYISDSPERVIPVHEHQEEYQDIHDVPRSVPRYHRRSDPAMLADNPVAADAPFFSFVLNDYFESNKNDDSLNFKGVDWENEFDIINRRREHDNYGKRENRDYPGHLVGNVIENKNFNEASKKICGIDNTDIDYDHGHEHRKDRGRNDLAVDGKNGVDNNSNDAVRQSSGIHDQGYEKTHKFNKHEHGDNLKENANTNHNHSEDNRNGFKNLMDQFANNFGGEEHNRLSRFSQQKNKENGEKKKGFHRVYHKDEYQEDKEFYDNTNNSANAADSGGSVAHSGGSIAGIQSLGAAALGNKVDILNKDGSTTRSLYTNNQAGNDSKKGLDTGINRYIDIARQTVNTNNRRSFH